MHLHFHYQMEQGFKIIRIKKKNKQTKTGWLRMSSVCIYIICYNKFDAYCFRNNYHK